MELAAAGVWLAAAFLTPGAVGDVVAKHAAAAGVRDDRRTAHALKHTFCAMLAERGVAMKVIRALAGHGDIRTTQIYVDVTDQRKPDGIAALEHERHPLAAYTRASLPRPPRGPARTAARAAS